MSHQGRDERVPHARGGGPEIVRDTRAFVECSPRAWGWTAVLPVAPGAHGVFPTRVGVDRGGRRAIAPHPCVPHARGGGPLSQRQLEIAFECSPRAWGWTASARRRVSVFVRVPHARGGGPALPIPIESRVTCSPRAWGWTACGTVIARRADVFPTRVGVDRTVRTPSPMPCRVPHARGGGPATGSGQIRGMGCSPRAWGWTAVSEQRVVYAAVFPTRVGVDRMRYSISSWRTRVPHARGGGPTTSWAGTCRSSCSPRAWGWTGQCAHPAADFRVFPTRVGVDRLRPGG